MLRVSSGQARYMGKRVGRMVVTENTLLYERIFPIRSYSMGNKNGFNVLNVGGQVWGTGTVWGTRMGSMY